MGIILGLDVGTSTTKIVALNAQKEIILAGQVCAEDQLTSLFGAIGKEFYSGGISMKDVDRVMLTGVGGSFLKGDIFGIPTSHVDEMRSIGEGGLFLSELDRAMIVSLGTGTTFVGAGPEGYVHAGGLALGGGTLTGLSSRLFGVRDFQTILDMARRGDLRNVDKFMDEISLDQVSMLPDYATASNLGKMRYEALDEDVALGIFNMIYQNVGVAAVFACRNMGTKDAVMIGSLASVDVVQLFLRQVAELYGMNFHMHEYAVYATAVGAAISGFPGGDA